MFIANMIPYTERESIRGRYDEYRCRARFF